VNTFLVGIVTLAATLVLQLSTSTRDMFGVIASPRAALSTSTRDVFWTCFDGPPKWNTLARPSPQKHGPVP
jgi:hypothetical protein